jgi:hypothetical protein
MAVTFGELIEQILEDTNRDGSTLLNPLSASTYKTAVGRAIITAIKYLESSLYWAYKTSAQFTITTALNSMALPADFSSIITVQFNIGNSLYSLRQGFLNITFEDLIALYQNTGETGIPRQYALFNNTFYVYPTVGADTTFTVYYYQKDVFYPDADDDTSIWFGDETVDLVRMKAMERFYHDTLQSSEIASTYSNAAMDFERNLMRKNNQRQNYNIMSI